MLTAEKNRQLCEVGPGTPMGELLRRYWMPIGGASEFDQRSVKPMKLLGEANWYMPRSLEWLPRLGSESSGARIPAAEPSYEPAA